MPREQAVNARKERNAALVETMLLSAMADGSLSQLELQTLLARVIERPEFEGTRPEELNHLVESSAKRLSSAQDLTQILTSLCNRLPDHPNRLLAFGLAASVAFSDRRASKTELGLLKTFQAAFGISEDEVAQVVEVVEQGGSLSEALGEPVERLYAEVMVLVSAADGKLKEGEARALVERFAADPLFAQVNADKAQAFVREAVTALATQGLPLRLQAMAQGLSTHSQRLKAYRLAVQIAQASGEASLAEQRILDLLQATFGLSNEEVERLSQAS